MVVKVTPRARVSASAAAKATPKKSAPAKKTAASKAPATKTASRATPARTTRKAAAPVVKDTPVRRTAKKAAPAAKSTRTAKAVVEQPEVDGHITLQERRAAMDPKKRIGGMTYKQLSELTGYGLGSEQFIAAVEIVRGAETKLEVNHRVAALLPNETRNGTPKQVSNLLSGVINNLVQRGFTVKGSWCMVAPKQ